MKTKSLFYLICLHIYGMTYSQIPNEYIQTLLDKSTAVQEYLLSEQIAREQIKKAETLPDTRIKFGIFTLQPETRVGNQVFKAGVSQTLPWFGSRKLYKDWLSSKAEIPQLDTEILKRELILRLKTIYYEIYALKKINTVLHENLKILKTFEKIALSGLEQNQVSMTDILDIQIKQNDLESMILQNNLKLQERSINFNRLLERDLKAPIHLPDSLTYYNKFINKYSPQEHPEWIKANSTMNIIEKQKQWIKKKSMPKITFGLDYIYISPREDMLVSQNGKDILLPTIGLSIPLYNTTYQTKLKQLQWQQKQWDYRLSLINDKLQDTYLNAYTKLKSYVSEAQNSATNLNKSRKSLQIALKALESGLDDFEHILQIQMKILKYQYNNITATKNIFIQQAKLEYLTE